MPSVVRRWHFEPSKKPCFARNVKDETACGALAPSSCMAMSPQVVARVTVNVLPAASDFGGTLANCFGFAGGFTVTAGQALSAAVADGAADGAAVGDEVSSR